MFCQTCLKAFLQISLDQVPQSLSEDNTPTPTLLTHCLIGLWSYFKKKRVRPAGLKPNDRKVYSS